MALWTFTLLPRGAVSLSIIVWQNAVQIRWWSQVSAQKTFQSEWWQVRKKIQTFSVWTKRHLLTGLWWVLVSFQLLSLRVGSLQISVHSVRLLNAAERLERGVFCTYGTCHVVCALRTRLPWLNFCPKTRRLSRDWNKLPNVQKVTVVFTGWLCLDSSQQTLPSQTRSGFTLLSIVYHLISLGTALTFHYHFTISVLFHFSFLSGLLQKRGSAEWWALELCLGAALPMQCARGSFGAALRDLDHWDVLWLFYDCYEVIDEY